MDNTTLINVPAGLLVNIRNYVVGTQKEAFDIVATIEQLFNSKQQELSAPPPAPVAE